MTIEESILITNPAQSCWTRAEDNIAEALSYMESFWMWADANHQDEAFAKLFWDELDDPVDGKLRTVEELEQLGGWACISSPRESPYRIETEFHGPSNRSGIIAIYLERNITLQEQHRPRDGQNTPRNFRNSVGMIMDELASRFRSGGDDYWKMRLPEIELAWGPQYNDEKKWDSQGKREAGEISVTWGRPET